MARSARKPAVGDSDEPELRRRAERALAARGSSEAGPVPDELRRLLHELQVHQIELEMQNEELMSTQLDLVRSRNRYAELYNFAPIGYLTLEVDGVVSEANAAAAQLFHRDVTRLIGSSLERLVVPRDRPAFRHHLQTAREVRGREICEIECTAGRGETFTAHLESEGRADEATGLLRIRTAILDVTRRVGAERELREAQREVLAVAERERRQLGADLHDNLGQWLTATEYLGSALREQLAEKCPDLEEPCARICANLREAISQTRALAHGLVPVGLEQNGLMEALGGLAQRITGTERAHCRFDCPQPILIESSTVAMHLYRIAQEAVNNALRHGAAREVRMTLDHAGTGVRLCVEDNGSGFDVRRPPPSGIGLNIMRHRATVIGGELKVTAKPGKGATVECHVPFSPE